MTFYQVVEVKAESYESRYEGKSRENIIAEVDTIKKANNIILNKLVLKDMKETFYNIREVER